MLLNNLKYLSITLLFLCAVSVHSQDQKQNYETIIEKADQYFQNEDYINAKAAYQLAINLKPEKSYPREQLKITMNNLRIKMDKSGDYTKEVSEADNYFEEGLFSKAIEKYQDALEILPKEEYPQKKIEECEQVIENQKIRKQNYSKAIATGDKLLEEQKLTDAKSQFQKARELFPENPYPESRIKLIDSLIYKEEQKQNLFSISVTNADFYLKKKKHKEALAEYIKANNIKPGNKEIEKRIRELTVLVNKNNRYDSILNIADELYIVKKYEQSEEQYNKALEIYPEKQYPSQMKATIASAIKNKFVTDQKDFDDAINKANEYFQTKNLNLAKKQFEIALAIKPEEVYPAKKLAEINNMLSDYLSYLEEAQSNLNNEKYKDALDAYNNALLIIPGNDSIIEVVKSTEKAWEDQKRNQAMQSKYERLITEADRFFRNKDYETAELKYNQASELKPDQQYPTDQINEIARIKIRLAEKANQKYDSVITEADRLFENEKYKQSVNLYKTALAIKANEEYPSGKISEAEVILLEQKKLEERDNKFNDLISRAEKNKLAENFESAITLYRDAKTIRPDSPMPDKKISEINQLIEIREQQKEELFITNVAKADSLFREKKYSEAKTAYNHALSLKPEEQYPQNRIRECEQQIEEAARKIQAEYEEKLAAADQFYRNKAYDKALNNYRMAIKLKPDEEYAYKMTDNITGTINNHLLQEINSQKTIIKSGNEKRFEFDPLPIKDRKDNYIYLKAKNMEEKEFKAILSYGSAKGKNGGAIINIPAGADEQVIVIRIGSQYKWFSENNNWISIYPEGGSLKVGTVRICRND